MTLTAQQDWSAYEIDERTDSLNPEADAVALLHADPATREKAIAFYSWRVDALVPTDDLTVKSCGEFVEQCKLAAKRVEEKRTALVDPLNKQVKEVNAIYMPVRDAFQNMAKAVTVRVNKFLDDRRKAAELEQQRLLAEAAKKQAELDRKAQEAKAKAAQALESGNEVAATVLESKAVILEQQAAEVIPMQVAVPSGKVELDTSTVSFGGAKKVWSLPGWADKKKPLRVLDPSLASLVGDLSKLPEGVRFILQHADLNPVYLNASYKGGAKFPAPFAEVNDYSGSRVR